MRKSPHVICKDMLLVNCIQVVSQDLNFHSRMFRGLLIRKGRVASLTSSMHGLTEVYLQAPDHTPGSIHSMYICST